jgi:4-amino-4-deoxychorismate lyase
MTNRTLLFGEGLFETIRWKPPEEKLKLHYKRLSTSAEVLGIPYPTYEEFLKDIETQTTGIEGERYVKYLLVSEGSDALSDKPQAYKSFVLTKVLPPQPNSVKIGISLYRRHSSDPICRHKTTSYLFNLLVKRQAKEKGLWDAIILNEKEEVCEASTANLLFLKGSKLYTPAKECGLLWGTSLEYLTRRFYIVEEKIKVSELEKFDAVYVLNSLVLCASVKQVEDISFYEEEELRQEFLRSLKEDL